MSTHGSRHQPHPGETGSGLALGAVSSQHSSAQAGGAQTVLGAQSPWRRSVCAPEGGREHKGPRHRHPRCLEPSTGPGALAGRGLCGPGRGERGGLANCNQLWEPPVDLYQEGFLKVGGGASGRITQRGCKTRQLLREASSATGTDHLIENRQRCVSFHQRNRAVFPTHQKYFL